MYNQKEGTAVHKQHGTAFSLGQLMELGSALLRALPKALKSVRGINPADLLKVVGRNGQLLELGLGELLSSMVRRSHPQGAATTSSDQPRRFKRKTPTTTITINVPVAHTPIPPYANCTLESDVEGPIGSLTLSLYDFLKPEDEDVKGDVMVARTKEKHPLLLGERHARALLSQAHLIHKSWQKYVLVFPGTVWQRPDGNRHVYYLYWRDGRWQLGSFCLDSDWYGRNRVVVPTDVPEPA